MLTYSRDIDRFGALGDTFLYASKSAQGLVIVLADSHALYDVAPGLASALNQRGYAVAIVNSGNILFNAEVSHAECIDAVTLLDVYSQHLQELFHFDHYKKPILIGLGGAASQVYVILQQAPSNLFSAGFSVGFQPVMHTSVLPCAGQSEPVWHMQQESVVLLPRKVIAAPWFTVGDNNDDFTKIATGVFPFKTDSDVEAITTTLLTALESLSDSVAQQSSASIDDLPLVELPIVPESLTSPPDYFVIIVSGDGGWANIDREIGNTLNAKGIPVVGWNSLQYFWTRKNPDQMGADLSRVIDYYQEQWQLHNVLLIGYSLGADVLPFMITRLTASQRSSIISVALIGLSDNIDFEFHVTDWVSNENENLTPVLPELQKIQGVRIQCFYGEDDDSLCSSVDPAVITVVRKPGDHHFNGDYEGLAEAILHFASVPQKTVN
jgi:type IV secretory pathway VirJ component